MQGKEINYLHHSKRKTTSTKFCSSHNCGDSTSGSERRESGTGSGAGVVPMNAQTHLSGCPGSHSGRASPAP